MFTNKALTLTLVIVFLLSMSAMAFADTDNNAVTFTTEAATLTVGDVSIAEATFDTTTYGAVTITTDDATTDIVVYAEETAIAGGWTHVSLAGDMTTDDDYTIMFNGDGSNFSTSVDIPIATDFTGAVSVQQIASLAAGTYTLEAADQGVGVNLNTRAAGEFGQEIAVTLQWQAIWE